MFRTVQKQAKRIFLKNLPSRSPTLKIKMGVESAIPTPTPVAQNPRTQERKSSPSERGGSGLPGRPQRRRDLLPRAVSTARPATVVGAPLLLSPPCWISWGAHGGCAPGHHFRSRPMGAGGGVRDTPMGSWHGLEQKERITCQAEEAREQGAPGPEVQLARLAAGPAWLAALGVSSRCEDPSSRESPEVLPLPTLPASSPAGGRGALCVVAGEPLSKQHFTKGESLFYVSSKTDI